MGTPFIPEVEEILPAVGTLPPCIAAVGIDVMPDADDAAAVVIPVIDSLDGRLVHGEPDVRSVRIDLAHPGEVPQVVECLHRAGWRAENGWLVVFVEVPVSVENQPHEDGIPVEGDDGVGKHEEFAVVDGVPRRIEGDGFAPHQVRQDFGEAVVVTQEGIVFKLPVGFIHHEVDGQDECVPGGKHAFRGNEPRFPIVVEVEPAHLTDVEVDKGEQILQGHEILPVRGILPHVGAGMDDPPQGAPIVGLTEVPAAGEAFGV